MAGKKVKLRLQGHEKFALREGWINKALMILPEHPDAFTRKDAINLICQIVLICMIIKKKQ